MAHVKTITDSEITLMLAAFSNYAYYQTSFYQKDRNILLFLLLVDAGLRVGELVRLRWYNLYEDSHCRHFLNINGFQTKTKVSRSIPLSQRIQTAVTNYNRSATVLSSPSLASFVFNVCYRTKPLSTRQVRRIINDFSQSSINRRISPHALRHTFATRLLRCSSTRVVQELLGHKSLSSTQIYTHPNSTDLRDAVDKM